jgi:hypothetical protein
MWTCYWCGVDTGRQCVVRLAPYFAQNVMTFRERVCRFYLRPLQNPEAAIPPASVVRALGSRGGSHACVTVWQVL